MEVVAGINSTPTFGHVDDNSADVAGDTALPLATETVIATIPAIAFIDAACKVLVHAITLVTTGVGATTVTLRIRRGSLAGALVGEAIAQSSPASSTILAAVAAVDTPGPATNQVYVITATAAGVAGTANHATAIATVEPL